MSITRYPFTLLRARPNAMRGESLNVGIVAFVDGHLVARVESDITRLRAFDPNLPSLPVLMNLQEDINQITESARDIPSQHFILQTLLAPIYADAELGTLTVMDGENIESVIDDLMARLVHRPERKVTVHTTSRQRKESKLNSQVKDWLRSAKVYSSKVTDLTRHRVVSGYPVSATNNLFAEFALMNGVVHVMETLDFRGHDKVNMNIQKEAAIKSIVLDQAKHSLSPTSKRIAVIAASDYGAMRSAINIINAYADDVVSLDSSEDKQRLADFISRSLHLDNQIPLLS